MGIEKNIFIIIFCKKAIMQTNTVSVGISFPTEILKKIDGERGDVSRSKYLLKIIERSCLENAEKK